MSVYIGVRRRGFISIETGFEDVLLLSVICFKNSGKGLALEYAFPVQAYPVLADFAAPTLSLLLVKI